MDTRKEVTIRLEPNEFERFDDEVHRRRKKKQQAMMEALELWMKKGTAEPAEAAAPAELSDATKEELAWCAKLVSLLREGDAGSVDLVQHALERQARINRQRRKASSE